jgi:superfamily II DNA helicase RecQ
MIDSRQVESHLDIRMCKIVSLIHYLQNEKCTRKVTKEWKGERSKSRSRSRDVIEAPAVRAAADREVLSSE